MQRNHLEVQGWKITLFCFIFSVLGVKYECVIYEKWSFTCKCKAFKDRTLGLDPLT